ncbi:MAG: acyltransferase family protein [Rhodocyclaceae bacterium]|nr:acyltransferase family protein [Rhodocyclaceae bacterium]
MADVTSGFKSGIQAVAHVRQRPAKTWPDPQPVKPALEQTRAMSREAKNYRREIDGLRAIAVLAVIANHTSHSYLPGGFLGVDVFFVISGFVITSSLTGLSASSFAAFYSSFFERRLKRLLPALALCVLITSAAICIVDPNPQLSLRTGMAAMFGASNFYLLWNATDYFARAASANAFTQTWSLGVEEQFYFLFPALVWVSGFFGHKVGVARLARIMGVLAGISLITYVALSYAFPNAAFYLMPARLWELAAGSVLFLLMRLSGRQYAPGTGRWLAVLPSLGLIALFALPAQVAPYNTAAAVALTLVLLATSAPGTVMHRALLNPAFQFLGKISYSLYLWHWSVLCIGRWVIGEQRVAQPALLALMLGLATCSYYFVERPLRFARWLPRRGSAIGPGLTAIVAVVASVAAFSATHETLHRVPALRAELPRAFTPIPGSGLDYGAVCIVNASDRPLRRDTFDKCTVAPAQAGGQTIWAMGDSHAGHLQGLLYNVHQKTGLGVHLIETPGVPFPVPGSTYAPREQIVKRVMQLARPGDIVVLSRIFFDRSQHRPEADVRAWADRVAEFADELKGRGINLVVVGPPPIFHYEDVDACNFTVFGLSPCVEERNLLAAQVDRVKSEINSALHGRSNAALFDSFHLLCAPGEKRCTPIRQGRFLYRDKDHLNATGAASMTVPFLQFLQARGWVNNDIWRAEYQTIDFRTADLEGATASGLGDVEVPFGRWTIAKNVEVDFRTWVPANVTVRLELDGAYDAVIGTRAYATLSGVTVPFDVPNGRSAIDLEFREVPAGTSGLSLHIPAASAPKEAGRSEDSRVLGLRLRRLTMSSGR